MIEKNEIKDLLVRILNKRKYRSVNGNKLVTMFKQAVFPEPAFNVGDELFKIKAEAWRDPSSTKSTLLSLLRPAALVPLVLLFLLATSALLLTVLPVRFAGPGIEVLTSGGEVKLQRGNRNIDLQAGAVIRENDVITMKEGAVAEIGYQDEVRLRITGETTLKIHHLGRRKNGALQCDLELVKGTLVLDFKKLLYADRAVVATPNSMALVRGTVFGINVQNDGSVMYEVLEGKINVRYRLPAEVRGSGENKGDMVSSTLDRVFNSRALVLGPGQGYTITDKDYSALGEFLQSMLKEEGSVAEERLLRYLDARSSVYRFRSPRLTALSDMKTLLPEEGAETVVGKDKSVLLVHAVPDQAKIYVDGLYRGTGSISYITTRGRHRVLISAGGYESKTINVALAGRRNKVEVSLERISGSGDGTVSHDSLAAVKSSYLLASDDPPMFISVDAQGRIDALMHGKVLWSHKGGFPLTSFPVWDHGRLYIATADDNIKALSLKNGNVLWRWKIDGSLHPSSGMALDGKGLFVGTTRGRLYRFSVNGNLIWDMHMPGEIHATPVVKGNLVFVPVQDGRLYGIDINLKLMILKPEIGQLAGSSIIVSDNRIYSANTRGELVCYNYRRDEIEWRKSILSRVVSDMMLNNGFLFIVAANGDVMKLNQQGVQEWKINVGGAIERSPVMRGENLYLLARQAFYVIDLQSGVVKWSLVIHGEATSNVVLSGQNAFFGTSKRGIVRIKL